MRDTGVTTLKTHTVYQKTHTVYGPKNPKGGSASLGDYYNGTNAFGEVLTTENFHTVWLAEDTYMRPQPARFETDPSRMPINIENNNGTKKFYFIFDARKLLRAFHYMLCVKKTKELRIGPSQWNVYVNPVAKLKDFVMKQANNERLRLDCPLCKCSNCGNVPQASANPAQAYIAIECSEEGVKTDKGEVNTAPYPMLLEPNVEPEYPNIVTQHARNMYPGATYKLCVDGDGPQGEEMGYGYAFPHVVYVSPIITSQKTVYHYRDQVLEFYCPVGCVATNQNSNNLPLSQAYLEIYVPDLGNNDVCFTGTNSSTRSYLTWIQNHPSLAAGIESRIYSVEFDVRNLKPMWYRLCFDQDGTVGNTNTGENLKPGWSSHTVYLSGIYNSYNYGISKQEEMEIFVVKNTPYL